MTFLIFASMMRFGSENVAMINLPLFKSKPSYPVHGGQGTNPWLSFDQCGIWF